MRELSAGGVFIRDFGGSGPALLLAHGMAAHTHWWDEAAAALAGSFRVAAFDFRGHGESSALAEGQAYSAEAWADDIEAARRALGWEEFFLCGHSMGARVALRYAGRAPVGLRALAAVDFLAELPAGRPSRLARVGLRPKPVFPDEEAGLSRFRLEPAGTALSEEALRALGRRSLRRTPGGWTWKFDWRCLSMPIPPVWPALAAVGVPALVVRGGESALMSRDILERVAAALPLGEAAEVPGAHHHVPLDRPEALAGALKSFFRWTGP